MSRKKGDEALRLSWLRTNKYVARNYRNPFSKVTNLSESWSDRLATRGL